MTYNLGDHVQINSTFYAVLNADRAVTGTIVDIINTGKTLAGSEEPAILYGVSIPHATRAGIMHERQYIPSHYLTMGTKPGSNDPS